MGKIRVIDFGQKVETLASEVKVGFFRARLGSAIAPIGLFVCIEKGATGERLIRPADDFPNFGQGIMAGSSTKFYDYEPVDVTITVDGAK